MIPRHRHPLSTITARHSSHRSGTSSRERQTCDRERSPFTSSTTSQPKPVGLERADGVQLALALRLVQLEAGAERDGMPVLQRALEGVGHGGRDGSTRQPAPPPGRRQSSARLPGGSVTSGLSSIQRNPQAPHRKNTLEDKSATTVTTVWSHTGQRAVATSSGGTRSGSLESGMGDQRCHIHVYRQWAHRYSKIPCVTPRQSGPVLAHDGQCFGHGSGSRRPLRGRARRSCCARRSVVDCGLGYFMRARRCEHTRCR